MSEVIKYYHGAMSGAPVASVGALNSTSMIALLKACLVDGWGAATVDSVTISSGIATVTISAGHVFEVNQVALIAGAGTTGGSINGEKRVISRTTNTYTFDATGIPDQTATGTITHKVAPLGWEFLGGATKAAFRSADIESSRCWVRFDDTAADRFLRYTCWEALSDIDTGERQLGSDYLVTKSWTTTTVANTAWMIVGDGRTFYFRWSSYPNAYPFQMAFAWGDFSSYRPADPYNYVFTNQAADIGSSQESTASIAYIDGTMALSRAVSGNVGAVTCWRAAFNVGSLVTYYSGSSSSLPAYPGVTRNELLVTPMELWEATPLRAWRGRMRGLYVVPQNVAGAIGDRSIVDSVVGLEGKRLMAMRLGSSAMVFFDLTGPWG